MKESIGILISILGLLFPILSLLFPILSYLHARKQRKTASLCCKFQYHGQGKYVLDIQNKGQAEARNVRLQELQGADIIDEDLFPCNCPSQGMIPIPFYLTKDICPDILKIRVTWDDKDKKGKRMDIVFEP
ncbi:MAG: hypothetical protein J1E79_07315 [Rikenella sp.]|nr:hypothetical protein [Rikenella sp.]